MKKTIIALTAVATLASAANAQVILGGTTYAAGTRISFTNAADFIAGTNETTATGFDLGFRRSYNTGVSNSHFNFATGNSSLSGTSGTAAWAAGTIDDFWVDDGAGTFNVVLSSAALGGVSGDNLVFANAADFLAGTNATINSGFDLGYKRSYNTGVGNSHFDTDTGSSSLTGTTGTATWAAGTIDDFWVDYGAGTFNVVVAENVPEPSSTALLGLGALGLLVRRKR